MVPDRDDSMRLFVLVPALSLAMESVLAPLDQLLEDDMLVRSPGGASSAWTAP